VGGQWQSLFVMDGFGRKRIERNYSWVSSTWHLTNEIHYVYDGMLAVQERDTNNNVLVTYTRGIDLSTTRHGAGGIGGLLARSDANGSAYYHADGGGNITALIDGNGNIQARAEYDAFGRFIKRTGSLSKANRYWFSSKELEPQPNVYYYGRRFFEPNFGRFLNGDPIGIGGGFNQYRFVDNNPLRYVDPFGLTTYVSDSPLAAGQAGTYGPYTYNVDDGSDAVVPAVPYLTDSQGMQDLSLDVTITIALPEIPAVGKALGWAKGLLGDGADAMGLGKPKLPKPPVKCAPKGLGNPFAGKTPQQAEQMMKGKGFDPRGPDPLSGKGGYVNPDNGRSYHIDPNNSYGEPPHMAVNRPPDYNGDLPKKKYPL